MSTTLDDAERPALRRAAVRRTVLLARANWTLLVRNRMTLIYAVVMPLLPLSLLLVEEPTIPAGVQLLGTTLVMALIFPTYYNLLSLFVSRRDDLVLKRLRTGELRDPELVTSMALPGAVITLVVLVASVPVAMLAGLPFPSNPLLLVVGTLVSIVTFAAFALWTAGWTKTAESAQLTSAPVIVLGMSGLFSPAAPESWQRWLDLLPGDAVIDLLRSAWFARAEAGDRLDLGQTWVDSLPALGVMAAWAAIATLLAVRSLRWEPRG